MGDCSQAGKSRVNEREANEGDVSELRPQKTTKLLGTSRSHSSLC
jgi:hypothetical protein